MKYWEYKKARQAQFDALPIFWAFSDKQFELEMKKRGLSVKDTKKVYGLGNGGFFLRSDAKIIHDFFNQEDELKKLMQDYDFAENAFYEEMMNHEYRYNLQGAWEVCNCFGDCEYKEGKSAADYLKDIGYGENTIKAYDAARARYYEAAREWD